MQKPAIVTSPVPFVEIHYHLPQGRREEEDMITELAGKGHHSFVEQSKKFPTHTAYPSASQSGGDVRRYSSSAHSFGRPILESLATERFLPFPQKPQLTSLLFFE
jgi:hypothetical protein